MKERPILMSGTMVRAILREADDRLVEWEPKTETRRMVKDMPTQPESRCHQRHVPKHPEPYFDCYCSERKTNENPRGMSNRWCWWQVDDRQCLPEIKCPYGQPGDRLWVKETWKPDPVFGYTDRDKPSTIDEATKILYRASLPEDHPKAAWQKWRPSLFMRRWMSRILLEIVSIRVERLHDITEEGAKAEGIARIGNFGPYGWTHRPEYRDLDDGPVQTFETAREAYAHLWDEINGRGSWNANPYVWVVKFRRIK